MIRRPPKRAWLGLVIFVLSGGFPFAMFLVWHAVKESKRQKAQRLLVMEQTSISNANKRLLGQDLWAT